VVEILNQKQETFCVQFWTGLDVSSREGIVRPCSFFQGLAKVNNRPVRISSITAQEALKSKPFENWRRDALEGRLIEGCKFCYSMEQVSGTSDRTVYNHAYQCYHGGTDPRTVFRSSHFVKPDAKALSPKIIFLHLGVACNLKCRICRPRASSQISNDKIHRTWAMYDNPIERWSDKQSVFNWAEDEKILFGHIFHQSDTLEWLMLSGGEALIMRPLQRILSYLVKRGASSHISLAICSNGTRPKDKLLDLLSRFKHVRIRISVDGVGSVNEYIRFPSVWKNVELAVKKWKSLSNSSVMVAFTLSAYNIFQPTRVAKWAIANGANFEFGFVQKPTYVAANVLPQVVLREAAGRSDLEADQISDFQISCKLRAIANHLRFMADHQWPDRFSKFVEFTNDLDRDRGQDITQALPELVTSIQTSVGCWDKHRRRFTKTYYSWLHNQFFPQRRIRQ
jgi:organic radical activating enzyme